MFQSKKTSFADSNITEQFKVTFIALLFNNSIIMKIKTQFVGYCSNKENVFFCKNNLNIRFQINNLK